LQGENYLGDLQQGSYLGGQIRGMMKNTGRDLREIREGRRKGKLGEEEL